MKFLKGHYLFTVEEIKKLMLLLGQQKFTEYNGKQYISLDIEKKSNEINMEDFKEVILFTTVKKEIIKKLGTSAYKLSAFCKKHFQTENILDIKSTFL